MSNILGPLKPDIFHRLTAALTRLVPAVCDVSVTNACNAACGFCSFARDRGAVKEIRFISREGFSHALPVLRGRGVRYITFQGGEPLLHPEIAGLVSDSRSSGMTVGLITNGWLLPDKAGALADAGLVNLLVSIDSHSIAEHERNRGLKGLGGHVREGLAEAKRRGLTALASVTVSRLVDFGRLPGTLSELGFDAAVFSYPRRERLGSSSLVFGDGSDLIDFTNDELKAAISAVKEMKRRFPVINPAASVDEILRHINGEKEFFPCVGGHKYFYLDWDLNVWRCEAWPEPMGSVFEFGGMADVRGRCTECIMACYRDASVLMRAVVALSDAASSLVKGRPVAAAGQVFNRGVTLSLGAIVSEARQIRLLSRG